MDTQDGASSHQVLRDHHQRCAVALARLQTLVAGDDTMAPNVAVRDVEQAIRQVIEEAGAAERRVLATLAGTDRVRSAARLLGGRLLRLSDAADHVTVALRTGDVSWLRRYLTRFDALTKAICEVQLDVYTSARAAAARPQTPARPVVTVGAGKRTFVMPR